MAPAEITIAPDRQDITTTVTFDAPPAAVFRAITDPELIPRWWGAGNFETTVERMELRPGGLWRYVSRDPAGTPYVFHGVCHDVDAPNRMVQTLEMEGLPGGVQLGVFTFEDLGGRTLHRQVSVFQSVEERDAWVQPGMSEIMREGMRRVGEIAEGLS
ncbi:ATPase [Actinoalloteichus sp. AHMU CJ021]|uniref:Conserved protein YndB, AHSA1/START domain n=1 Tax=Actinoalloteichus caeruleus DSM 43889 TaxID=1120930 RepID=A0ABT1JF51_ACTCY|nr:SRPBCC family protein [Actinoalloteichus caeruleus]AUS77321.1 ATPase [Actinoalloteichus sp. AHMU CJ021]MCP2331130.1 putative conserved protein YndB, AHSA1/START domain [Actinoalloteichus caeruleus DSM 43889]